MKPAEYLPAGTIERLSVRSDLRAGWLLLCQWGIVAAVFALVAHWPSALSILLGTVVLGGRQLGFGILSHECGHRVLFRSAALNALVGNWLAAAPVFGNNAAYMRGHLEHHRLAGTRDDPDLANYRDYPISRQRLRRKLKRDVTGQTGWRALTRIGLGLVRFSSLDPESRAALARGVIVNLALIGVLTAAGATWLYLLWVAAFVFVQPLVSRIRQVAEHAAVPDLYDPDPRKNTRTVYSNPLTRLLLCPHQVNYHLEHHLLASVPIYNLRRLHRELRAAGAYEGVAFPRGYLELLRSVTFPGPERALAT